VNFKNKIFTVRSKERILRKRQTRNNAGETVVGCKREGRDIRFCRLNTWGNFRGKTNNFSKGGRKKV